MAIDFDEPVDVKIPGEVNVRSKDRDRTKQWAKMVDGVPASASTGNDWNGDWLTRGTTVDMPIGSLYLVATVIDGSYDVGLRMVMPGGMSAVVETSRSKAWAQELRKTARRYLAMPPRDRTATYCREWLAEASNLTDEVKAGRRREWLAGLETPPDPKADAIAKIRAMMAEHGITADDLKG